MKKNSATVTSEHKQKQTRRRRKTTTKSVSIVIFVRLFQMEHFSCEKQNFVLRVSVFLFVYFAAIILHTPDFYGQINIRSGSDICEIKSARHGMAWLGLAVTMCCSKRNAYTYKFPHMKIQIHNETAQSANDGCQRWRDFIPLLFHLSLFHF